MQGSTSVLHMKGEKGPQKRGDTCYLAIEKFENLKKKKKSNHLLPPQSVPFFPVFNPD